jgi:thiamine biosynthesis lipoprotein
MALLMYMKNNERWSGSFKAMGTDVVIDIVSEELGKEEITHIMENIEVFFKKMEQIFSRFRVASELSFVNNHVGAYVQVSEEFIDVVERAIYYHDRTGGYFDPRIYDALIQSGYDHDFYIDKLDHKKSQNVNISHRDRQMITGDIVVNKEASMILIHQKIDLSGIVKGWVVDQARSFLRGRCEGYIIDAGGDMWVEGKDVAEKSWYVGIEGLKDAQISLCVDGEGLATSGVTRRQWIIGDQKRHHLIDPKNEGMSAFDLSTVTVIARSVEMADVWAKTIFLMGMDKGMQYAQDHHIKAIIIDKNNTIYATEDIQQNIVR